MPLPRIIVPELLDQLPPEDPRALKSRRDLRRLNFLMGHLEYFVRALTDARIGWSFHYLVELGAGDGNFALRLARRLAPLIGPMRITLLDQFNLITPAIHAGFEKLGWQADVIVADVLEWISAFSPAGKVGFIANLFLHHFTERQLHTLLNEAARHSSCFVACEPRRSRFALTASRFIGLVGCNKVTRHDATISVRAGFREHDLSRIWPKPASWKIQEGKVGLFSHGFSAVRQHKG